MNYIDIYGEGQRIENYYRSFQLVDNPNLIKDDEIREQLIYCQCFAQYRVLVNGNTPIADTTMEGVKCPICGTDAKNYLSISGHSAGIFNASVRKI